MVFCLLVLFFKDHLTKPNAGRYFRKGKEILGLLNVSPECILKCE